MNMDKYVVEYWICGKKGESRIESYEFEAEGNERAKEIAKENERILWMGEENNHVEIRRLEKRIRIELY